MKVYEMMWGNRKGMVKKFEFNRLYYSANLKKYLMLTLPFSVGIMFIKEEMCMETKILMELVNGILNVMGERVISIILYGSTARGTNTEESDVDIAVLMQGTLDADTEEKLSDFVVDMNLEYDKVFSVIDIDFDMFKKWEKVTPFYQNVSREGVVLWKAA